MDIFNRINEYMKSFFNHQDKRKLIENAAIVIIIGIIILIAGGSLFRKNSSQGTDKQDDVSGNKTVDAFVSGNDDSLQKGLESILALIEGAGKVNVMITYSTSNEIIPATDIKRTDNETSEKDNGGGNRDIKQYELESKIVYEEAPGGTKKPIVTKELKPQVRGVVIVADGAGDTVVRDNLTRAAQALLDVPIHKVQVYMRKK